MLRGMYTGIPFMLKFAGTVAVDLMAINPSAVIVFFCGVQKLGSALALGLRLSCTNTSIYWQIYVVSWFKMQTHGKRRHVLFETTPSQYAKIW